MPIYFSLLNLCMLCLKNKTNPGWIKVAIKNLPSVVMDHAHCEKKAAGTGTSLLSTYFDKKEISLAMSDLVEEEIGHYRSVINILDKMGLTLGRDEGDEYAKSLLSSVNKNEPMRMMDRLITAGIIEARSCERLQILAENIENLELKKFYKELSDSEAGHYVTFIKLAKLYFDEELVRKRLDELTQIEAEIIKNLSNKPLMHG
ncbi:tRNA 2-methylthio-cis-ribozeatin biosynthesis protein [Ignavibacterium album JCM 16511]|uniref:tRNA 2-methylthio-cis-ribozeatin biosynthesis protein n=1 Tax=Ignavibacterium album (strain DSM 19864 / JCM 16511 / NBRC 101810 / Mat9-16) TaxID=945713 RepID=I0AGX7_IGNAJ|nr:tRNA-(ms[2]io[6]A)-hydroxylase [Ignavibacterium album]AFH48234.1 tRNA 2-methylthio-cis-ribozeatin biosynthesis protein [Ignavibacterium album JCM 16511]